MSRLTVWLAVAVLALSLATLGGCNELEMQLADVQQQYNDLQLTNQDLQTSLAACEAKNNDLSTMLMAKDGEVNTLQTERDDLAVQLAARVPAPPKKDPPTGWTAVPGGAKITLSSDILFSSGRATLSSAGSSKLRSIAGTIKGMYPNATVRVYGFTDSDPIVRSKKLWADNLDLSANRAMAVTRHLRKLGIPDKRIETVAMGKAHPIAPNSSSANKSKNRRVEIAVIGE